MLMQNDVNKFESELNKIFGGDSKGINFAALADHPKKEKSHKQLALVSFRYQWLPWPKVVSLPCRPGG